MVMVLYNRRYRSALPLNRPFSLVSITTTMMMPMVVVVVMVMMLMVRRVQLVSRARRAL
jgi:hypothetical protein